MLATKRLAVRAATVLPIRSSDRQLQELYARRAVVQTLIQSLEEYGRSRTRRIDSRKRKTA